MGKLTDKREAFVAAYIGEARFNATKAALMAGYSPRTSYAEGSRLLKDAEVSARVKQELSNRSMSADAVLSELADLASSQDQRFSTTRLDPHTGDVVEIRTDLNPRIKALELLGKAHGLFTDRVDISGTLTAQVQLVGIDEGDI